MTDAAEQVREMIGRETLAWDTQDVDLLLSVFHPDMVWPWPESSLSHDPLDWVLVQGRFNRDRWRDGWLELFTTHTLVHNHRETIKVVVSKESDAAFAVVDIDTLWRTPEGTESRWSGRTCKSYVLTNAGWKMTMQTGPLRY